MFQYFPRMVPAPIVHKNKFAFRTHDLTAPPQFPHTADQGCHPLFKPQALCPCVIAGTFLSLCLLLTVCFTLSLQVLL